VLTAPASGTSPAAHVIVGTALDVMRIERVSGESLMARAKVWRVARPPANLIAIQSGIIHRRQDRVRCLDALEEPREPSGGDDLIADGLKLRCRASRCSAVVRLLGYRV